MEAYVFLGAWVAAFLVWLSAIVDGLRRPKAEWAKTGRPKEVWAVALVALGIVAGLYYWLVVRRDLNKARAKLRHA